MEVQEEWFGEKQKGKNPTQVKLIGANNPLSLVGENQTEGL